MPELEIGTLICQIAMVVGVVMCCIGWMILPTHTKFIAGACVLMFIGYQIIEFIGLNFIVVAK
jgi:hypothetical protein